MKIVQNRTAVVISMLFVKTREYDRHFNFMKGVPG